MKILSIKTSEAVSEVAIFYDQEQVANVKWQAHFELAETLHLKIRNLLDKHKLSWDELGGMVVFRGPGSFTGLRIGLSVANALAYSLTVPIVADTGTDWEDKAIKRLLDGENQAMIVPEYGSPPHITKPKR
jgi:tRNA threonylcarbamoyladenosine biosynthesis protein TsaB